MGLRFTNVAIPKGALVLHAYLQFQVDNTTKNTDPANIWIKAQDEANPLTFDANINSRLWKSPPPTLSSSWPRRTMLTRWAAALCPRTLTLPDTYPRMVSTAARDTCRSTTSSRPVAYLFWTSAVYYANGLWTVDTSGPVSFAPVAGTVRNCSGTVTSWGTVVTSEENLPTSGDLNGDGYIDIGWNIEIDPLTRKIRDYGNGPQKLWAMSHENIVVAADQRTAYEGEDSPTGGVYKFVADAATNLSSGQLYVLKLDQPMVNGESTGTTGTWVPVPNTTVQERNGTAQLAAANGTTFNGVEDVEINPFAGQIYFSVKGVGRVYLSFKLHHRGCSGFRGDPFFLTVI